MKFINKEESIGNNSAPDIVQSIKNLDELSSFIEVTDLPSKFKYYSPGTKVFVRPFSVKDVKALANMTAQTIQQVTNSVIMKNLRGISLEQLTVADKYYLIFLLRALTYKDAAYSVNFYCDHCFKKSSFDFNAQVLDVEYAKDIEYSLELPISKKLLTFKVRRVADEIQMKEFVEINGRNIADFDMEIFDIAGEIDTVDGEKISLLKAYEFVMGMSPQDFVHLISYLEKLEFGIVPEIQAKCKCGGTTPVGVNFQDSREFFIPRVQL